MSSLKLSFDVKENNNTYNSLFVFWVKLDLINEVGLIAQSPQTSGIISQG